MPTRARLMVTALPGEIRAAAEILPAWPARLPSRIELTRHRAEMTSTMTWQRHVPAPFTVILSALQWIRTTYRNLTNICLERARA